MEACYTCSLEWHLMKALAENSPLADFDKDTCPVTASAAGAAVSAAASLLKKLYWSETHWRAFHGAEFTHCLLQEYLLRLLFIFWGDVLLMIQAVLQAHVQVRRAVLSLLQHGLWNSLHFVCSKQKWILNRHQSRSLSLFPVILEPLLTSSFSPGQRSWECLCSGLSPAKVCHQHHSSAVFDAVLELPQSRASALQAPASSGDVLPACYSIHLLASQPAMWLF